MLNFINRIILKILPSQLAWKLKNKYRSLKRSILPKISTNDLKKILCGDMELKKGDIVFVHSSITKLNLEFPVDDILEILLSIVGSEGTLLFPCWHFRTRAEEYLKSATRLFDVRRTHSKLGFITEQARRHKGAYRSLHPTNSIVAIGMNAKELTQEHHLDVYPCGEKSPFYKMMKFGAKIIGIGVNVENFTFYHCVEDIMKEKFPMKIRKEIFNVKVINYSGNEEIIRTLVASKNTKERNLPKFFSKNIPSSVCRSFKYKHSDFFVADSNKSFKIIEKLAFEGKTIYNT